MPRTITWRPFEFEAGVGINMAGKINGGAADIGLRFFIEPRLNIVNTPLDVGLQLSKSSFTRQEDIYGREHEIEHKWMLVTFVDYNLREWDRVVPFAGLGIGAAAVDNTSSWLDSDTGRRKDDTVFDRSFVFNPRIGVELYDHVRITAEYKWMRKEYSFWGLSIGVVFGGGQKK